MRRVGPQLLRRLAVVAEGAVRRATRRRRPRVGGADELQASGVLRMSPSRIGPQRLRRREAHGLASTQTLGPILDGLMRNTPDALEFIRTADEQGVGGVVARRDRPFGDYGQAPEELRPTRRTSWSRDLRADREQVLHGEARLLRRPHVPLGEEPVQRRVELRLAPVARRVGARDDRRAVARREVLAEVARAREGRDLQDVAVERAEPDARPEELVRWPSLPHSGGGCAPGGGAGANGPIVRNSAPTIPSGVQLEQPDGAPGTADAHELVGDRLVVGREHRADRRHDDVEGGVAEGQVLRVGLDPVQPGPCASARARPASSSSGVRSLAVTSAPARAAAIDALPVPAPTSRTRIPGPMPHACTSRGPQR